MINQMMNIHQNQKKESLDVTKFKGKNHNLMNVSIKIPKFSKIIIVM